MGPPSGLVLALARSLSISVFVETGTYRGDTAAWAEEHFASVVTIELSPEFHAAASARFRTQPRIRTLQGNSEDVLAQLLPSLNAPAVFWLDAHWSGLDTAGREAECPLLAEIGVINESAYPHVILVDDARLFMAPPPLPHRAEQWPDLEATVRILGQDGRRHVAMVDDVFVAVPMTVKAKLVDWLQNAETAPTVPAPRSWWRKICS